MFVKEFEPRWSDLDANRHLANSAYFNLMSHTRMSFFREIGITQDVLVSRNLGPVVFYEHMYYFREVLPDHPVRVTLEFMGMSGDGMFFEFHHDFYDTAGIHLAHCELMGGWIDMGARKLTSLNPDLLAGFSGAERAPGFRVLTREDTRRGAIRPKNLG